MTYPAHHRDNELLKIYGNKPEAILRVVVIAQILV